MRSCCPQSASTVVSTSSERHSEILENMRSIVARHIPGSSTNDCGLRPEVKDILRLNALEADRRKPDTRSKRRKIREVADIAAALVLPSDRHYPKSVADSLNTDFGRRAIIDHRKSFSPDMVWRFHAPARLGLLRVTLSLLERPRKPQRKGTGVHGYGLWLTKRSREIDPPGRALIDPLLFLALELVPDHRQIVTERSAGWRSPIRTRWKAGLGALGEPKFATAAIFSEPSLMIRVRNRR